MRLGVILLAAGRGVRFGGDKLAACVEGRTLFARALDVAAALGASRCVAVVSDPARALEAKARGLLPVLNDRPEAGISRSIRLGLDACDESDACDASGACDAGGACDAYLFMVGDQPYLRAQSVRALIETWERGRCAIACLGCGGEPGNPVIFAARFAPELRALSGDVGGKRVMRAHPELVRIVQADPRELWDMDTPQERRQNPCSRD